ncbi:V-ATPase A-subunit [Thermotoga neapolitana LA10]|nr:V-ATPase A-subunit [Thermotoga neapolitana LA10]
MKESDHFDEELAEIEKTLTDHFEELEKLYPNKAR